MSACAGPLSCATQSFEIGTFCSATAATNTSGGPGFGGGSLFSQPGRRPTARHKTAQVICAGNAWRRRNHVDWNWESFDEIDRASDRDGIHLLLVTLRRPANASIFHRARAIASTACNIEIVLSMYDAPKYRDFGPHAMSVEPMVRGTRVITAEADSLPADGPCRWWLATREVVRSANGRAFLPAV